MMSRWIAALVLISWLATSVYAQVAMQGSFAAAKSCPAVQSIKKETNPGDIAVEAGRVYRLLGKNKEMASHYWIEVPGAAPLQRWVAIDCGLTTSTKVEPANTAASFYVLALSWEPAFCEGLPGKVECQNQTAAGYDASHFSLHGLWPQPRSNQFCNIGKALIAADDGHRWLDLPEPELSPATRVQLDMVMPGTQSQLERHEWIKHGSCYSGSRAETYFKDAIRLMAAINTSPVQAFFAANIGKSLAGAQIRKYFDEAFGAGAGQRLRIACKDDGNRRLIIEMTLGLKGDISPRTSLAKLIAASSPLIRVAIDGSNRHSLCEKIIPAG